MEIKRPPWLKAMENGALGEARTKAYLLDRFWILERSVDIHGADFIIQRRLTNKNILDRDPPRLGVVQAKFYGSNHTTHYILKEYALDEKDVPRDEFFLLCHTGKEDNPKMYFLTAKMLNDDFKVVEHEGLLKFKASATELMKNDKYLVKSKKNTLDRIENQLKLADFTKNRKYLAWQLPSLEFDKDAILPDYKEPIDNWWGDIPSSFKAIKESAHSALFDVEEIYNKLKQITEEVDPIKALERIKDISYHCRDGFGRWRISLPDDLYNQDFETACNEHFKIVSQLRQDGLLDDFLKAKNILRMNFSDYICKHLPIDSNTVHSAIISFSKDSLKILNIENNLVPADRYWSISSNLNEFGQIEVPESEGIKDISQGKFECFWLPGRFHIEEEIKIEDFYKDSNFRIYYLCMNKILNDKYHFDE